MGAYLEYTVNGLPYVIAFDATLSEIHELSGEATKHSVEKGSDIVDHVIVEPDRIS